MKPLPLTLIGFLFLSAIPVQAAESSDQYADLRPVSEHYIAPVVERVKAGLEYAKSRGSGGAKSSNFLLMWGGWIAASVLGTVDTDLRLTEQERDLLQNSPCLRVDALILEGWMERARLEKMKALEDGNAPAIYALVQLQRYLNSRFKALLSGAYDPAYKDTSEGNYYAFDPPPYWCCPADAKDGERVCKEANSSDDKMKCVYTQGVLTKRVGACVLRGCTYDTQRSNNNEPNCPYSTDYFPPTVAGYGCDTSILDKYKDKTPQEVKKEYEALRELVKDRDKYIRDSGSLRSTVENISELLNLTPPDMENFQKGLSENRKHRTMSGCVLVEQEWPQGLAAFSARGPFGLEPTDILLLTRLNDLWTFWGSQRVSPDYLKFSWELDPGKLKDHQKNLETSYFSLAYLPSLLAARSYLQKVSTVQLGEASFSIPKASDAPARFLMLFAPLREQVNIFVQSSQSNEKGMRGFARNFAFFLRRSCIFRPCNKTLDRILKIVFEDTCFPYAAGLTEGNPEAAKDCKENAKL